MPADDSLRRLGGGRWETRDGRFAIEPQSGTWAVVDTSQTNELGLPLVHGPFRSLTAAREAIEEARQAGSAESPLAARIDEARRGGSPRHARRPGTKTPEAPAGSGPRATGPAEPVSAQPPPATTAPPPQPRWLRDLAPADRRRARDLVAELQRLGIADAEAITRAEIALDQPALTRLAIERRLREVIAAANEPGDAVRAAADVLLSGRDRELDVRWRLVDVRGRPVTDLDLGGQGSRLGRPT